MTTTTMSNAQLLEIYNKLAEKPIKAWKQSKEKLLEKIAFEKNRARGKKTDEVKDEEPKKTSHSGRTIREASEALLLHVVEKRENRSIGYTYEEILEQIMHEFQGVETTVACLRWYAVHLNKQPDVRMPVRPRKRVKRGKEKVAA